MYSPLVTPFKDNEVDYECFAQLCHRQLEAGVAGLVPCGTTGERRTPTLTTEEWERLIQIAVSAANGRVPVIAGCGSNATAQTVANVQRVKELGADAGLVVFPYYNKPNPEGLKAHVEQVCAQGLPIVLYHSRTDRTTSLISPRRAVSYTGRHRAQRSNRRCHAWTRTL